MNKLTKKQLEAYEALQKFISKNGFSPSFREMGNLMGHSSSSTIYTMLKALQSKGYIVWEDGQPRTMRIIKEVTEEERKRLNPKFEYAY